ncbi:Hypothetical protein FKW44_016634 [Caligus rogercresseyi]|uniref:Uncharacterized protein n=1 Tax=Caligus rogercresseyi TaxID=217165 RepID=A0A7T8K1A8_CALRO|nr:Hypothetical protein FKW44_016634 [Caligus rogercresseyi]
MDVAIPIKTIKVHRSRDLYLAKDTLDLMNARDRASGDEYRACAIGSLHLLSAITSSQTSPRSTQRKISRRHSGVWRTTYLASPRPLFPPH